METKSGRGRRSSGLCLPPGTGALTTCKTLFNLNPLINISNHTSPSTEGEKENLPLVLVHFLTSGKKECVCVCEEEREIEEEVR